MRALRRWFWTRFGQRYYTLDLWMALGKDPSDFYGSQAEADHIGTWARLLAEVRANR